MLIVNDDHRQLAGVSSLANQCKYCKKALASYPLVLMDDAEQTVYHVTCALELATEIMVDLYTFFSPPAPSHPLYILTAPEAASAMMLRSDRVQTEGVTHAMVNGHPPDEGGHLESSLCRKNECELPNRACRRNPPKKRAAPGNDLWVGTLVPCGRCAHCRWCSTNPCATCMLSRRRR